MISYIIAQTPGKRRIPKFLHISAIHPRDAMALIRSGAFTRIFWIKGKEDEEIFKQFYPAFAWWLKYKSKGFCQ